MPVCNSTCVGSLSIPSLAQVCDVTPRNELPSKLILFTCSTAIPSGNDAAKAAALDGLITSGDLGASAKLVNFVWGDPQQTDKTYADCFPATKVTTQRDLTFEDYNAIDVDGSASASPYFDRDFWATVKGAGQKFYFGWTTCDGLLYLACQDRAQTTFMTGILSIFETFDATLQNKREEVKKGTISFLGDPLALFPKPYLNLAPLVSGTASLATLY